MIVALKIEDGDIAEIKRLKQQADNSDSNAEGYLLRLILKKLIDGITA